MGPIIMEAKTLYSSFLIDLIPNNKWIGTLTNSLTKREKVNEIAHVFVILIFFKTIDIKIALFIKKFSIVLDDKFD